MIMNPDRYSAREAEQLREELAKWAQSLPEGYLPDEDDPAWPSRSGQGD
ncbi:MAG: hypothetical protein ACOY93_00745 [Bacillota bacterium]